MLNSISFNEKNLLTISVKDEKIILASVQPGSFTMIDSFDTAYDIKLRSHNVNINQKYYIGITEVTQGLRDAVMNDSFTAKVIKADGTAFEIPLKSKLTAEDRRIILAGGRLNVKQ